MEWAKVKLGSLLTESKIESINPNPDKRITVRLNVKGVEKRPLIKEKKGVTKYYSRKAGQFIYGKQNLHKGAFGIVPKELDGFESTSDIPAFDVHESCYPEWVFYFFKKGNLYLKLENLAKGVGSKRIQPSKIYQLEIYLPAKKEQEKILKLIRKIEKNHTELTEEIEKQEGWLIKLRQSILQDAVQGKLTETWRKGHPDVEGVSKSLERIATDKKQLIEDKKIKKEISLPPITVNEIPFEIPQNWEWCRFQSILIDLKYGTSKKSDYDAGNTKILRIPNIVDGKIDLSDLKSSDLTTKERESLKLKNGDLLIIRSNGSTSLVGRTAVVKNLANNYAFAGYLVRARIFNDTISSDFVHYVFESKYLRESIEIPIRTTSGVKNINSTEISKLLIPIPSYKEQLEINSKVSELLNQLEEIKSQINFYKQKTEEFLQRALLELLGSESTLEALLEIKEEKTVISSRQIKYDNKTTLMDLVDLLNIHGRLHAEDLWKMSKQYDGKNVSESLEKFYAELKKQIEEKKAIRESSEKGYLELA